jgi:hypothetical protein
MVTTAISTSSDLRLEQRRQVLVNHGATATEVIELLAYNQNLFDWGLDEDLEPEAHVAAWQGYLTDAATVGVWESLRRRLVQLQFPVQLGMSEAEEYRSSTRRGIPVPTGMAGLQLRSPDCLELSIHQSWAGPIPVIFAGDRADFELLVQALSRRNEPVPIPAAMGACMVAGFNNWDRIASYRRRWETQHGSDGWDREWRRLIPHQALYQDRFIILSDSPYSNVAATALGVAEDVWRQQSRQIRLEHESIHYWTRRCLGSMQNNLLDELLADYWGLVAATGEYRADWWLHFLGLEGWPIYRSTGRMGNYQGTPALSAGAWEVLQSLVVAAAQNLERVHGAICQPPILATAHCLVKAMSCLTLEEIAMTESIEVLAELTVNFKNKLVRF